MPILLNDLKESSEFLNLLLDNIDAAVLVADENLQVHQFNKSFFDLFDRAGTPGSGSSFGQIAGCVNAVRENRPCGKTYSRYVDASLCAGTNDAALCENRLDLINTCRPIETDVDPNPIFEKSCGVFI